MIISELLVGTLLVTLVSFGIAVQIRYSTRYSRAVYARLLEMQQQEKPLITLNQWNVTVKARRLNGSWSFRGRSIVFLNAQRLTIYDPQPAMPIRLQVDVDQIRWFGRPNKYTSGMNTIWIHAETADGWNLIEMRLGRELMGKWVAALKSVLSPAIVTAYRRRRPYIHSALMAARPAVQDIHGGWSLEDVVHLYVMPLYVVIFQNGQVLRKIPLEAVQQIGALRRLDRPGEQGLIRFQAEQETFAFAVQQHEILAGLLAEAAKRTLETPLERKRKNKDEDDEDD